MLLQCEKRSGGITIHREILIIHPRGAKVSAEEDLAHREGAHHGAHRDLEREVAQQQVARQWQQQQQQQQMMQRFRSISRVLEITK